MNGESPIAGCFYFGKSQSKMDENWGYPYDSGNHHRIVLTPVHGKLPRITWPAQHRTLVFGTTQGHGRSWETGAEQTESNFGLERKLENVNETTTSECGYLEQNMNDPVKKNKNLSEAYHIFVSCSQGKMTGRFCGVISS